MNYGPSILPVTGITLVYGITTGCWLATALACVGCIMISVGLVRLWRGERKLKAD